MKQEKGNPGCGYYIFMIFAIFLGMFFLDAFFGDTSAQRILKNVTVILNLVIFILIIIFVVVMWIASKFDK